MKTLFALLGVFFLAIVVVSVIKKISFEQAMHEIIDWIREELFSRTEDSFILSGNDCERIFNIIVNHSRLGADVTFYENYGSKIKVQILPRDDSSIAAATAEVKIFIRNLATVSGRGDIDVEVFDEPSIEHSRFLVIYVASTEQQKKELADLRQRNAHMAAMEAGAELQPFTDENLQNNAYIAVSGTDWSVMLGFDAEYRIPIFCNFAKLGHLCAVGGTGSGKSVAVLYFLCKLLDLPIPIDLYIGDFKKSGDYTGISKNFVEAGDVVNLIDDFYNIFEATPEGYNGLKILILDEYAGFMVSLTQQDKKRADEIRGKIANLLMLGRSRHCYVWCIQQRMSATLFPSGIGAIDNFQICVGLGSLSPDSRKSLFAGEWPEETPFIQSYQPGTGKGLILIDGKPIRPIAIPQIDDKSNLVDLCRKKAAKLPL